MAWKHVAAVQLLLKLVSGERAAVLTNQRDSCEGFLGEIWSVLYQLHHFCLCPIIGKQKILVAQEPTKMDSSALVPFLRKVSYTEQSAGDRIILTNGFLCYYVSHFIAMEASTRTLSLPYYVPRQCRGFFNAAGTRNYFGLP